MASIESFPNVIHRVELVLIKKQLNLFEQSVYCGTISALLKLHAYPWSLFNYDGEKQPRIFSARLIIFQGL
jgi:hypothetical protein